MHDHDRFILNFIRRIFDSTKYRKHRAEKQTLTMSNYNDERKQFDSLVAVGEI